MSSKVIKHRLDVWKEEPLYWDHIFALSAWQESPLFSDSEKSALQIAEEITHISVDGVTDKTYENLKTHFNAKEIADIIVSISHINFLNRIGISTKTVAL